MNRSRLAVKHFKLEEKKNIIEIIYIYYSNEGVEFPSGLVYRRCKEECTNLPGLLNLD